MFADCFLTASANSLTDLEAAANSDLQNLSKWLIANRLRLNVAKTEFMLIGSKPMNLGVTMDNSSVWLNFY